MARDHGFHPVRIIRVVEETADTRTFVLDASFPYQAGQFVTIRACDTLRSYSMSSSPATDSEFMTTVKRVPGGLVSNWMHDHLAAGDVIETTLPAGVFCLRETTAPLVAISGGSGITPILSLVKTALATTDRQVRLLTADRTPEAVIFADTLAELAARYPERFTVRHHIDCDDGYVTEEEVLAFVGEAATNADRGGADFYVCGPTPFMDLAERALLGRGVDPGQIFIERFLTADEAAEAPADETPADGGGGAEQEGTVTIVLHGKKHTVPQRPRETLLQSARRAGLAPPFSCEAGNCATCIAQVTEGEAKMKINNALDDDEVAEGWVLTCQGQPVSPHITVVYED